jgi:putative tricarboxylic transport membrane protein
MRRGVRAVMAGLVAFATMLAASGCVHSDLADLRIMVPNAPGSGYDITARTAAKAIEDAGIVRGVEVFNLPGAGGAVGLRRLTYEKGNGRLMMLMGLGLVGAQYTSGAGATLHDTTPIARLMEEPEVVVVTKDSPYDSLRDLVDAWRAEPGAVTVGGGSSPGGPDHLAAMLIAKAIGIAPKTATYIRYDGGGELLAAILGKHVSFGVSGVGEIADQIRSGQLRVLAVTSGTRVDGLLAPTLLEAGVDVLFTNWRGIVAPPDLSRPDLDALSAAVGRLHDSSQWRRTLDTNGWTDAYLASDDFGRFLGEENDRLATVLRELGLA